MAELIEFQFEFRNKRYTSAEAGLKAFSGYLDKFPDVAASALKKELRVYLEGVAEALARRHGNPWPGGTTSKSLSKRSGALTKSIKESVKVYGDSLKDIEGRIGASFYGRIQEYGGTIKPKKAKYLTIPLPAALNSDGTPKKKSARQWAKTFIIKSKAGNLLIVQRVGKEIVPLYVLKTEVKIPPRLKMGETLRSSMGYFVDKSMEAMYKAMMEAGV